MHRERRGEVNSLAQSLGVFSRLQPGEGLISQARVRAVKGYHDFSVCLAYCICEDHSERYAGTASFTAKKPESELTVTQGRAKGQRVSQFALPHINGRERNTVWHPSAHPAICDYK